nr:MAG TPA: hypothetical protein [Caudoviricetes sp.]
MTRLWPSVFRRSFFWFAGGETSTVQDDEVKTV